MFTVKEDDFKKFTEEAKRYGVLFCALKNKGKSVDGMVDIMVRAEDASKINRIVERFKLSSYEEASIRSEIQKSKDGKSENDKGVVVKSVEEKLVDDILSKPISKEENEVSNPQVAKMEKSPLSEPTLKSKNKSDQGTKLEKPSVREEIKEIRKEQEREKANKDLDKSDLTKDKEKNNTTKHKQSTSKKKKSKERG